MAGPDWALGLPPIYNPPLRVDCGQLLASAPMVVIDRRVPSRGLRRDGVAARRWRKNDVVDSLDLKKIHEYIQQGSLGPENEEDDDDDEHDERRRTKGQENLMKLQKNNPPGRGRSQQARTLTLRAAFRQPRVLVLLVAAAMAFGCGSSGGDAPPPPEESDIWDEMSWDEGSWALYHVPTVDTLG
jgi:hypothetical protein